VSITKKGSFPEWYQSVIFDAKLIDNASVKGCYIIRPQAVAIWNNIKNELNKRIEEMGVEEYIFPLLIPQSFLEREKDHIEGFAPEVAVVTHAGGSSLKEPLVIRPTSETIIHSLFSKWINSWRDLPLKVNQWANVVRWEKRPRAFLRSTEFWWQEGHTAHATEEEARNEVLQSIMMYEDVIQNRLAIPTIRGKKPDHERFAGAEETHTLEGCMGDGKALQMATSHLLGVGFCEQFSIHYRTKENILMRPSLTSWGATTRLLGALIMVHGDDKGIVVPPAISPVTCVSILLKGEDDLVEIEMKNKIALWNKKTEKNFLLDTSYEHSIGERIYHWEKRGIPFQFLFGKKEMDNGIITIKIRDNGEKITTTEENIVEILEKLCDEQQKRLYQRALNHQKSFLYATDSFNDIMKMEDEKFFIISWCGCKEIIKKIKEPGWTIRCFIDENKHKEMISDIINMPCAGCKEKIGKATLVARAY